MTCISVNNKKKKKNNNNNNNNSLTLTNRTAALQWRRIYKGFSAGSVRCASEQKRVIGRAPQVGGSGQ